MFFGAESTSHVEAEPLDVWVGIDIAYDNMTELKLLADELCTYTNLFVIGCTGITYNTTKLYDACQYVYDKGFSFIIYSEMPPGAEEWFLCTSFDCTHNWGDKLLGIYAFDEGGGRQLDYVSPRPFSVMEAENLTDASTKYVDNAKMWLQWFSAGDNGSITYPLYTSDYALYWFDYKVGYDTVFAEFGWNYSRQLNVALCRGAATVQDKDWGVTITWTYNHPPYLVSGSELYDDMVLAYNNGAKYITIFDANKDYTEGILKPEHFDALKRFWSYIKQNPRTNNQAANRVAYVVPKDYAYSFRGPYDKVWGLWDADQFTVELCEDINKNLEEYGTALDIIYDDGLNASNTCMYNQLIFWNGTTKTLE
ncbi:MAG: hypothetical protein NWF03_02135 [Candidatus Bathyarchaeota archaeon]|nr:hypothetical protein [Candidatus Bathyarchaeota archaeon]